MHVYKVGQTVESLAGGREGMRFDMADDGGTLLVCFHRPTSTEIESVRRGQIRFKLLDKSGIILLFVKFEDMPWMEAPYHVGLSKNLTELQSIEEGQGYACHIVLVDISNGRIEALRLIGLGTKFSRWLKSSIEQQQQEIFNIEAYSKKLSRIFRTYSTKRLVEHAEIDYKTPKEDDDERG